MTQRPTIAKTFRIAAAGVGAAIFLSACGGTADTSPRQDVLTAADVGAATQPFGPKAPRAGDLAAALPDTSADMPAAIQADPVATAEAAPIDASAVPVQAPDAAQADAVPAANGAPAGDFNLSGYGAAPAGEDAGQPAA